MNPADLQRRLDAAALPAEEATPADWARNVALVRSRTRGRRVRGVVLAGLATAAAVAVALSWHPAGEVVRVEPAAPDPTTPRLVAPGSLSSVARECARTVDEDDDVTPVFAGRTDVVEAVLYRYGTVSCTSARSWGVLWWTVRSPRTGRPRGPCGTLRWEGPRSRRQATRWSPPSGSSRRRHPGRRERPRPVRRRVDLRPLLVDHAARRARPVRRRHLDGDRRLRVRGRRGRRVLKAG